MPALGKGSRASPLLLVGPRPDLEALESATLWTQLSQAPYDRQTETLVSIPSQSSTPRERETALAASAV